MTDVYVVRNQLDHYWGKSKVWVDGTEPRTVMRAKHEDEAVNMLFELSSHDVDLRGRVEAVALTAKGDPDIEPSANLIPKDEPVQDQPELEDSDTRASNAAGESQNAAPDAALTETETAHIP